jgi:mono/diheme cytochrome c family protein
MNRHPQLWSWIFWCACATLVACEREQRPLQRGDLKTPQDYSQNAYAVSQGKLLFRQFNCSGCHAQGGGGMGPPLMDEKWRYGSQPEDIFASIMSGRPNGMPAFANRITEDYAWQLAVYVRSMSGQLRSDVAPSRNDSLQASKPETRRERLPTTVEHVDQPILRQPS